MYIVKRFEDKIVAVTGGAKGIGKGCCLRFAQEGARVAVLDLALQEAAEVAAECERLSGQPALLATYEPKLAELRARVLTVQPAKQVRGAGTGHS